MSCQHKNQILKNVYTIILYLIIIVFNILVVIFRLLLNFQKHFNLILHSKRSNSKGNTKMSSYPVSIYFVDAFTTNLNSPFTGNPAAVCFLDSDVGLLYSFTRNQNIINFLYFKANNIFCDHYFYTGRSFR